MKKLIIFFFICNLMPQAILSQWFTQQSGTTSALYDIEFINKNTGWCSGDGVILKTTNGGINWINKLNDAPFKPYAGIHPVDSNIIYAVGFFRTFIKTTNGGDNWSIIENGSPGEGDYYSVNFLNQNIGWTSVNYGSGIVGTRNTEDGGNTFTFGQTAGIPQDLFFKDSLNGVGVGGLSEIFRTTDGGLNWSSYSIVQNGDFYRVSFINENTGYTASHRAVYKTTNFGLSWDSIGYIPAIVQSISYSSENIGFVGTHYAILKTSDGGKLWLFQVATGVVYDIYSFNDSLVWTCGNAGRIWHTTNGGMSFIQTSSSNIPYDFNLFQNHPNPFNNQTKIRFNINKKSMYILEIFNSLGKKIEEIIKQTINPGEYEVSFNAENLSSGIYYYRLSDFSFSETKKFVLIK